MTVYLKQGISYKVTEPTALNFHEKLPAGNYIIEQDREGNFYLNEIDSFVAPGKIYGNTLRNADRILNTFLKRPASTGVLLNGEKGSGKTLLSKMISIEAAQQGIPTIVVNRPWKGDGFNNLMQSIDQPCIVLFDEFEKVYDRDDQEAILTLFDGVFPSKKLFMLTCNDKYRVDTHMRNRPGRIFYMLDFAGLDQAFIAEYCADNLDKVEHTEMICKIATMFDAFNFDMLKALIEEMNRYGETPQEAMAMLNAKPEFSDKVEYDVAIVVDNQPVAEEHLSNTRWRGNPLASNDYVSWFDDRDEDKDEHDWINVSIGQEFLQKVDAKEGRFVFSSDKGTVILTRTKPKTYNYYDAL